MLVDSLKTLLGTTAVFNAKTQGFHWNIEGTDFPQYHKMLNKIYDDAYGSIDRIAEYIRTLDKYAPGSLTRFIELSVIEEQTKIPRTELMLAELQQNIEQLLELISVVFEAATTENRQGIANYMAELEDIYSKWNWQLKSTLKRDRD